MPYLGVTKTMTCRGCAAKYTATSTGRLPQWCSSECKRTNGPKCKICGARAKSIQLCAKHEAQFRTHGGATPTRDCKQCGKTYQITIDGRGRPRETCSTECRDARALARQEERAAILSGVHCKIGRCEKPIRSTGSPYCEMHYGRIRFGGTPGEAESRVGRSGERHHHWAGDNITYRTAHTRVHKARGAAATYQCIDCGKQAQQWSYNHLSDKEQWGLTSNGYYLPYSADVEAYDPRCISCHQIFDEAYRHELVHF